MSTRIVTATTPTQPSIMHNAPKTIAIAGLLAAALTTATADAATWSARRHYQALAPDSGRAAHYAPAYYSRYGDGFSEPSQQTPFLSGRGIFEEHVSAP